MVNGNYVLYGDRPSSESEIIDDHVQTRTAERKNRRKSNRTANDLQRTLNMAQLDNETDSVKFEKKIKEPRLLRYVSTLDVEENYVNEKYETYDLNPTEEPPRRYAFQKKPKNHADGSVNYAYSRSSSSCSSPNGNLPTISENGEQYGTYKVRSAPSPCVDDIINGYDTKMHQVRDTYFKTKEGKGFCGKVNYKGSHIDSLHRVPNSSIGDDRMARVLRVLRWPVALVAVCIALAVFVYFLMPDSLDRGLVANGTYWETVAASVVHGGKAQKTPSKAPKTESSNKKDLHLTRHLGTKTPEIDFYDADNEKIDFSSIIGQQNGVEKIKIVEPVFPNHVDLEVQYGNEKADSETFRTGKVLEQANTLQDTTSKPHITQKPEKPLEVLFKEVNEESTANTDNINRAETINEYTNYGDKQPARANSNNYGYYSDVPLKVQPVNSKNYFSPEPVANSEVIYSPPGKINFTSGHSNLFGISIEDAEKMRATTQSYLYNTRVSPTLPTWRDRDDSTTKKYPVNVNNDASRLQIRFYDMCISSDTPMLWFMVTVSQCRSTRISMCRGVLPYDLAGPTVMLNLVEMTRYLPQIEYLISTNCSDRVRLFFCSMLEPECSPPPYETMMPCEKFCRIIEDNCENYMPQELTAVMKCNRFKKDKCIEPRSPCHSREFSCSDQTCIPRDWICDGNKDCPDGEDEQTCSQCEKSEFRCKSGNCIHKRWMCDGYSDCPSGDDEEGCAHRPDEDRLDPGEEPAGSAPAPAIRRPGKVATLARAGTMQRSGDIDSSKELLIASDSSNALKRNYTRRPSPSRLSPYSRSSVTQTQKKPFVPENSQRKTESKRKPDSTTITNLQKAEHNDSQEDVNIGDLGFLEDSKKESIIKSDEVKEKGKEEPKPKSRWAATTTVMPTKLDKTLNKMERVINGAALLKAAEEESFSPETNSTNAFEDEQPIMSQQEPKESQRGNKQASAHSSPCPSGELRCVDGRCITLSQLCDGNIDCTDHADEDNCYT